MFALHKSREISEYYFYIVVLSVSEKIKIKKNKCPNNKKEIYNDKYKHTRDRLFGLIYP